MRDEQFKYSFMDTDWIAPVKVIVSYYLSVCGRGGSSIAAGDPVIVLIAKLLRQDLIMLLQVWLAMQSIIEPVNRI